MRTITQARKKSRVWLAAIEKMERRMLMSAGALDPSFGTAGQTVFTGVTLANAQTNYTLASDAQSRTLVGVSFLAGREVEASLKRLNANGSIDTTFNATAAMSTMGGIRQILPEGNGETLVLGSEIELLTSTGTLDKSFSIITDASAFSAGVVLSSGKFMTIDGYTSNISRFNANGTPDTTYGTNGVLSLPSPYVTLSIEYIKLDSSGRIDLSIAVATSETTGTFGVARLLANGQLDTSFGFGGYAVALSDETTGGTFNGMTSKLAIAPDGSIDQVAAYEYESVPVQPGIFTYSSNGRQIGGAAFFPTGGPVSGSGAAYTLNNIAVQSDGKVIVEGSLQDGPANYQGAFIDRFEPIAPNSAPLVFDASFDGSGMLPLSSANGIGPLILDNQGRIVAELNVGPLNLNLSVERILTAGSAAFSPPLLTGAVIGTARSYENKGNTAANAFDGNLSTYFDAPGPDNDWAGLDLGSPRLIAQISYAPRPGFASRMIGAVFQGSNSPDFANAVNLYVVPVSPPVGSLTTVGTGNAGPFRYVRYLQPVGGYGNIAEAQFFGGLQTYTGTAIGTAGSYENQGNTIANVFDGDLNSFFDAPTASGAWVGLDLGSAQTITQISFAPRAGYTQRMVGGEIQASNSANFSSGVVTAYTITTTPLAGTQTTIQFSSVGAYRYWRYVGPTGSYCNICELEFAGV